MSTKLVNQSIASSSTNWMYFFGNFGFGGSAERVRGSGWMASISEDENFHWSFQCQPSNFYFYNSKNCWWCGEHTWLWWLLNQLTSTAEKKSAIMYMVSPWLRYVLHAFQNMGTIANILTCNCSHILTWSTWPPARCTSWRSAALLSRAHQVYKGSIM